MGSRSKRSISASPRARSRHAAANAPAGPGADDRHARSRAGHHAAVRSAVPCSAKNSRVELERVVVLLGQLEVGEDRVDRARLDAGVAVDADLGIDVELLRGLEVGRARLRVDAVDGTDLDAGVVLDAAAGDDVRHGPTGYIPAKPGRVSADSPARTRRDGGIGVVSDHESENRRTRCCRALTLSGAVAGHASASVPNLKGTSIVTGKKIGGAKVGMTKAELVDIWGKLDRCQPTDQYGTKTCEWVALSTLRAVSRSSSPTRTSRSARGRSS